jgi:L-rhamnose mutarotase
MAYHPKTEEWWDVCKPCEETLNTRKEGEWWVIKRKSFLCLRERGLFKRFF